MVVQLTERFGINRFLHACTITKISRTLESIAKIQTTTHIYVFFLCSSVIGCGPFVCSGCCCAVILAGGGVLVGGGGLVDGGGLVGGGVLVVVGGGLVVGGGVVVVLVVVLGTGNVPKQYADLSLVSCGKKYVL